MAVDRGVRPIRVRAFAKVNLTLRVLGRRDDGYHELQTKFQSLALHDSLTFTSWNGPFQIECDDPACPSDSTNLVWRAAERIWGAAGRRSAVTGVRVRITKRIPMQAGLGGGSSDAAAAIRVLARLWQVDLKSARVQRIASDLGADVPFFLRGGTVVGLERGNVLIPQPDAPPAWVVLVLPAFGVRTVDAYRWWDADNPSRTGRVEKSRVPDEPQNDLQAPVASRHPEIGRIVRALQRLDASQAAMSGSGSAVFGLFKTRTRARAVAAAIGGRSLRTLVTRTVNRASYRAAVGPVELSRGSFGGS